MATGAHKAGAALRISLLALCVGATFAATGSGLERSGLAQKAKPADSTSQQTKVAPTPTPTPTPAEQEVDPDDVISVETTEILLPVTVRDATGELVSGLTRTDFRVFEDGLDQPLSDFSLRKVPVDAVLMVDASSSVSNNLDDFRVAAEGFGSHLAVDDRISLIQFDDRVLLLQDWTKSLVQLRRALRRVSPGMFTRFNDALLLAARDQTPRANARHAIIVLTDGIDSGRGSSFETALRAALQSQTTIYIVSNSEIERAKKQAELSELQRGTDSSIRFNEIKMNDLRLGLEALAASEQKMERLTSATGGRLYKPQSFSDLEKTYAEVADELRHQYALYYSPVNRKRDGAFRRVRVETRNPALRVSHRIGYFAPK